MRPGSSVVAQTLTTQKYRSFYILDSITTFLKLEIIHYTLYIEPIGICLFLPSEQGMAYS
jgi:hypothetical protein